MSGIKAEQLADATGCTLSNAQRWAEPLSAALERWNVQRLPQFLAQITHESGRFTRVEESLLYTTPERLMAVWPKRFPTRDRALPFVHNPEGLANTVYANRLGNGGPETGDGWRYRGRGLIQITGRATYQRYGAACGLAVTETPDLLLQPQVAADSAAWFWADHFLDQLTDVRSITRVINGGEGGLDERLALTERATLVFGAGYA